MDQTMDHAAIPATPATLTSPAGFQPEPQAEAPQAARPCAGQPAVPHPAGIRPASPAPARPPAPSPSSAFVRAENEDDDGYDPYSDRPARPEPLFESDPWR